MTRDLARRLEQMAGLLKHGELEEITRWENLDQIRGLLREAASAVGVIQSLLSPEKFSCKRVGGEAMRIKITTVLDAEAVEELILLFAEHVSE